MLSVDSRVSVEQQRLREMAADLLKEMLKETGVSQAGLAIRLGLSEARVSRVVSGHENVTLDVLVRFADALGYRLNLTYSGVGLP